MPSVGSRAHGGYVVQESREIGTLFQSEVWWRDCYDDIIRCGYQLRPRYRPGWVPSWRGLNKDFFSVEDGQPCLVCAICLVLSALTDWISYGPQWMLHAYAMESELCSKRLSPKKGPMNYRSVGCSRRSRPTRETIVCHCSTLSHYPTPASG